MGHPCRKVVEMTPPPISAEDVRRAAEILRLEGLPLMAVKLRELAGWLEAQENSAETVPQNMKGE